MITKDRLHELLDYDSDTGIFTWKVNRSNHIRAGSIAGSIDQSHGNKYIRIFVDGRARSAHRLAWLYVNGDYPSGQIDHIDGDGMNNAINNLRDVSQSENQRNSRVRRDNSSGLPGVSYLKSVGLFQAYIKTHGKQVYLGRNSDFFEACCLRKSAENKYGFHQNHGRR